MTDNQRYAPSGSVLCGCPVCSPRLEALVRAHLAHSPQSWTRAPLDHERPASPTTPLPAVWHGFHDPALP